jgi:uncharacterized protein (TIGR02147 family)
MAEVFEYTDYREYLNDYYVEQKSQKTHFSYKYLANKAGFKNKGFVYNLMNGSKKISKSSIFKLSKALNHTRQEAEYFENLIAFNQAKSHDVTYEKSL